jgi:adenylate cyclase
MGSMRAVSVETHLVRKLAAVLYADVAGYSRLMGVDEDDTHRRLSAFLDVFDASVQLHNGRTVHYAGDAILADFETATDALSCAVSTQVEFAERNSVVAMDRRLEFRIGLNIGEVIIDRNDIYGEGVNVAARLEALAEPGGICLSEAFRTLVGNRLELAYEFMGERRVKNIAEPLRVYRVRIQNGSAEPERDEPDTTRPTIAVLALDNMNKDPDQEYFSDGISEDIITDLSKLSGLTVIARNSSFAYKGQQVDVREICKQLGVRYLLEGSVRKAGERVRVTVQLIDGSTGAHLWAERFDRDLTDIFEVQDEIRRDVVAALGAQLTTREARFAPRSYTANLEAYDYFLKGREQALRDTSEANQEARAQLTRALDLDPKFSLACSHLSRNYVLSYVNRWGSDPQADILHALELASRAIELDADNPHAHFAEAMARLWSRQQDHALSAIERAVQLDSNFADGHAGKGLILVYLDRAREGGECIARAMRLDPHYRDILLHIKAMACFHDDHFDEAIDWLRRRLIRKPESDISRVLLASAHGHSGSFEQARTQWQELMRVNPGYSIEHRRKILPYRNASGFDRIVEGLELAGIDVGDHA